MEGLKSGITLEFVIRMIKEFKEESTLQKGLARAILLQTNEILRELPTLVEITVPDGKHINVCGDVHGQFYDLANIFEINGLPSDENPYLFNGDFVDRGLYLARGNHECRSMTKVYGFECETESKLDSSFVDLFAGVFCCLPLAHVINNRVLVVHGGLFTKHGVTLDDIRAIDRFREPPAEGVMCELLWSDPSKGTGRGPSPRGVGITFGVDVTDKFLKYNGLDLIVRSHEVKDEGYEIEHDGKLVTVFSAPNYCDQFGNKGALIRFEAPELKVDTEKIVQFGAVSHPDTTEFGSYLDDDYFN